MKKDHRTELIAYLTQFVSNQRIKTINDVLDERTRHLTLVLEDLHKPHNANAVLRSCDGFGIQDVYMIENRTIFGTEGTVSIGAHQWLTLHRYNHPEADNISECVNDLKKKGYQIVVTTPHTSQKLPDLDITKKTALVFGTELDGVSERMFGLADKKVRIPMYGFSESFNLSVSAAVCLYEVTQKIRRSDFDLVGLSEEEKTELRYEWLKRSIKASDKIIERFLAEQ